MKANPERSTAAIVPQFTAAFTFMPVPPESNVDAARRMDGIYRLQRHVYDATRKFYLLGRDRLIQSLPDYAEPAILEIGCGTGRNLVKLAQRFPSGTLSGIDVSSEMLATAKATIDRARLSGRVALSRIAAEPNAIASAVRIGRFDIVLCSYVLSMIPDWASIVREAIHCLRPGGVLAVVDFKDQRQAPGWRRFLLLKWLAWFHVSPRAEIEAGLAGCAGCGASVLLHEDVADGYAYLLLLRREAPSERNFGPALTMIGAPPESQPVGAAGRQRTPV